MPCALYFTVLSENTIRGRRRKERKKEGKRLINTKICVKLEINPPET
jgi:hypothetical protein